MPVQKYDIRVPLEPGGGYEVRYWSPTNLPILSDRGEVAYILHQVEDVTETVLLRQKGVEQDRIAEALRASKDWFSTTLNSIGDAVIATDVAGSILFMNPVAERTTNWDRTDAGGKSLREVLPLSRASTGEEVEIASRMVRSPSETISIPEDTMLRRKDGRVVPINDVAAPISDESGKVIGHVIVFRDDTKRQRSILEKAKTKSALNRSEERFRTMADAIPQLAWMALGDGSIFWYNKRWYDYTGTAFEEMQGWGWQSVHDPAELPRVPDNFRAAVAEGKPWEDTFPLPRHDGSMRPHLSRAIPRPKRSDDAPSRGDQARGRPVRVLIVDDNVDTARGLARLLKLMNHEIRTAHEGASAIAEARQFRPEFVLLDLGLPGMDGCQVARNLREEGLRDAVIIAISGYGQEEDRRRTKEVGVNHHLVKPVDYDALISFLEATS